MIEPIYDLNEILKSDADLFFFDIEDTILASNIFYDLIGYKEYCKTFLDLCQDVKVFDVTYLGKNYKRILMQQDIPEIIRQLKKKGKKIFALTSGYPSHQKKIRIRELGIMFDGFLFTRGADKGPFLAKFLSINSLNGKCAFIDNHVEKIANVEQEFLANFPNENKIDLFLYKKQFVHSISIQDFIDYWAEVIKGVKRGEIDKLKLLVQREKDRKKKIQLAKQEKLKSLEEFIEKKD